MKSFVPFLLIFTILFSSCTKDNSVESVQDLTIDPEEDTDQSVDPNIYMFEVNGQNTNCMEDYINLDIDGQTIEYYYNNPNGGVQLCTFSEGNVSGIMCETCEGHFASLPMPISYRNYFPGLPIEVGGEFPIYNGTETITEIFMDGFQIMFLIPGVLTDNLFTGSYHVFDEYEDPGVSLYINWAVDFDSGSGGYTIYIDTTRPYEVVLECIDRSNPDYIQLTGNFEGIFVGHDLLDPTQIGYEVPISGRFSYKIAL